MPNSPCDLIPIADYGGPHTPEEIVKLQSLCVTCSGQPVPDKFLRAIARALRAFLATINLEKDSRIEIQSPCVTADGQVWARLDVRTPRHYPFSVLFGRQETNKHDVRLYIDERQAPNGMTIETDTLPTMTAQFLFAAVSLHRELLCENAAVS